MYAYWTLFKREVSFYLTTLTGYIILSLVSLMIGLSLMTVLLAFNGRAMDAPLAEAFYATPFYWFIVLLACPAITMRSFSHEMTLGTFEALMTAPVTRAQVLWAKYLASWLIYAVMWVPLLGMIAWLGRYVDDPRYLGGGPLIGGFIGVVWLGGLFLSIGCFASAIARSQLIAAMLALAVEMVLFLGSFVIELLPDRSGWQARFFEHICLFDHMTDFSRGIVDSRHGVFYVSLTAFFLYLTWRVLEWRR